DAKRFDEVVVGARVNAFDALGPRTTRCKDEHGHHSPSRSPSLEDGETIHFRQAEVQYDEIVVFGVAAEPRIFAVARNVGAVAGPSESCGDARCDFRLVLDDEDAHQSSSIFRIRPVLASTSTSLSLPCGVR